MKPYIIEYLDNQPYVAVIIGISYESPLVYFHEISEELNEKSISGEVLFDMLLHSGNGNDRFFEITFNGEKFSNNSAKNIRLERRTPLRKRTSQILCNNPNFVDSSSLNIQQKNLIKHGCCI